MTLQRSRSIEQKTTELLSTYRCMERPVPVDRLARCLRLRVEPTELGDDVSGVLVVADGGGIIGYNAEQHFVRQRFTIAHEIGHFCLHYKQRSLFIDKQYTAVFNRDTASSQGDQKLEIEANRFASCLLLPHSLVLSAIREFEFDLGSDAGLKALADAFAVSSQAMSIRLAQMNILPRYS